MNTEKNILISQSIFGTVNIRYVLFSLGSSSVLFVILHKGLDVNVVVCILLSLLFSYLFCMISLKETQVFSEKIIIKHLIFPGKREKCIKVKKYNKIVFREMGPKIPSSLELFILDENGKEKVLSIDISNGQFTQREKIGSRFSKLGAEVEEYPFFL